MKKVAKNFLRALLCSILILASSSVAYAATSSYSSTYDMTGGVFSAQTFTVTKSITVDTYPTKGISGQDIWVYTGLHNILIGWYADAKIGEVSSTVNDSVTYSTPGTYKIYLRNWTGLQMTGGVRFTWR